MKTALVLSGGGAKGAFQVGVLRFLRESGFKFDVVAGVSVGSLNGCMVAQEKWDEMEHIWATLTEKDITRLPKTWWFGTVWNNLFGKKRSLYLLDPLMKILDRVVKKEDFKIPYYCGITSLITQKYYSRGLQHFETTEDLKDGIYASSLMPILWEPTTVRTTNETIEFAIDGGVKNVVPLEDLLKEGVERIVVVTCNNAYLDAEETYPHNILETAKITFMDMMIDEIVKNDTKGIKKINHIVKQAETAGLQLTNECGRPYKHFELIMIQPPVKNIGTSTDFSRDRINANIELGYNTAKQIIENLG